MVKKAAGFVLARHCRLTISAAFTNVTRFIQRVVNLRGSTYRAREKSPSRQARGRRVRKMWPHLLALLRPRWTDFLSRLPHFLSGPLSS